MRRWRVGTGRAGGQVRLGQVRGGGEGSAWGAAKPIRTRGPRSPARPRGAASGLACPAVAGEAPTSRWCLLLAPPSCSPLPPAPRPRVGGGKRAAVPFSPRTRVGTRCPEAPPGWGEAAGAEPWRAEGADGGAGAGRGVGSPALPGGPLHSEPAICREAQQLHGPRATERRLFMADPPSGGARGRRGPVGGAGGEGRDRGGGGGAEPRLPTPPRPRTRGRASAPLPPRTPRGDTGARAGARRSW